MNRTILSVALLLAVNFSYAQSNEQVECPPDSTSCTIQQQQQGDVDNTSRADGTQSNTSQSGNSSASNSSNSGIDTSYDNSAQTTQNATTETGDVSSRATGNTSQNQSSAGSSSDNSMGQSNTGTSTSESTGGSVGNTTAAGGTVGNTTAEGGAGGTSSAQGGEGGSLSDSGNAAQGQQQRSGSKSVAAGGAGGTSGSSSRSGDSSAAGGYAAGGTSGGNVIDTRNQSTSVSNVSYRTQYIPSITQAAPIAVVPGSQLQKDQSSCGPRKVIVKSPAEVLVKGLWRARIRNVGYNYELQDAEQPWKIVRMPDGSTRAYGHEVVEWAAVRNVSVSSSLQIGGGGDGGDWAQAGLGGAGGIQDIQTKPTLYDCEVSYSPIIVERFVPQYIQVPAPKHIQKKRKVYRKPAPKQLQDCINECKAEYYNKLKLY